MLRYVIWGTGIRGIRLFEQLQKENEKVVAFIDTNEKKIGEVVCGRRVVSLEEYQKNYPDCFILISFLKEREAIQELETRGIYRYFNYRDCPGDFQHAEMYSYLKKYILGTINSNYRYGIYGCTLFGILLYKWICEKCHEEPFFIYDKQRNNKEIINFLAKQNYNFIESKNVQKGLFDKIYQCVPDKKTDEIIETENVYDCSDRIPECYNPHIAKFHELHRGERCFIVATGPSLSMKDLEVLRRNNEICFSMNYIWKAFDNTKWRPDFYFVADQKAILEMGEIFENLDVKYLFIADAGKEYWEKEHNKNIIKMHVNWCADENGRPVFSQNCAAKCCGSGTVTYICMQLAVYMGFQEIYLLGVDCTYIGEKDGSRYTHFYQENSLTSVAHTQYVSDEYCIAKQYADEHGIKIYNATRGGKLEVFERVDFDSLFDEK